MHPDGEVTRLLSMSRGGWATNSESPAEFARGAVTALSDPGELQRRGEAAWEFSKANLAPAALAEAFELELGQIVRVAG